ncbi:hypothetical protein ACP4OV_023006 [Aristida adscensionis]
MAREHAELEDFVMDPIDNKAAFRALRQYVKGLDSNTLPPFLARICASHKPRSYSEEEILCIFETAAEVHGQSIVPHIGQIVSRVIMIMASVPRSMHSSGCLKVICSLSRFGIDPLAREEEKIGVMSSLCRPLSDCLMNANETISSGSALCITDLVQSNNWQYASSDLVNDVCLKVSGALEEARCQTVVHLGLVVALSKHNPLTLEPYGRSLIRSGLLILENSSSKAINSRLVISSIQMIQSIMENLDARIISSEINNIIDAMERCQVDCITDICTAASQATETAKLLCRQVECRNHKKCSPLGNSTRHSRKGSNSPIDDMDTRDSGCSGSPRELQSAHALTCFDSQRSVGSCAGTLGSARARRRLWNGPHSHGMSNDDIVHSVPHDSLNALGVRGQPNLDALITSGRRCSGVMTRTGGDPCPTCLTTNQCTQISVRQALSGDTRMQSTPKKQLHSFIGSERDRLQLSGSPAIRQVACRGHCTNHLLFEKTGEFEGRNGYCNSVQSGSQWHIQTTDLLVEDLKFPTHGGQSEGVQTPCEERGAEHQKMTRSGKTNENRSSIPFFPLVCVVVIVAFLLAWWKQDRSDIYYVPT